MKEHPNLRSALPRFCICPAKLSYLTIVLILSSAVCFAQNPASPGGSDGWVVLPVDDYRALRQAAFPSEPLPAPPPVEATLTRVDYELRIDGAIASGEARLAIDVIKDGWVRVAIPGGLMIRQSRLDGRQVSLVHQTTEKGVAASYLLLSRTGRSVLALEIVAPISAVAGTEMLHLPASASAITRAAVTIARQAVDVRITGGLLTERADTANEIRWVANGNGNEPLTFAWKRKIEDQRAEQPLRLRGAITQLIGLGEDNTQINAEVEIEVLQGLAREVRLQLPDHFAVNQVSGAMIADWEEGARELVVTFLNPVQQTTRFTLSGEMRLPREGRMDVPLVRLSSAERETGGLAVEVLGAGEIKDRQPIGLEEAEASDLGALISSRQSPSLVAFRLRPAEGKSARSLAISVARYTPQAVLTANIEEAQYNVLVTEDGKMLVQARLAVRNNQRNFLKLSLPANAALWSAAVAGRPVRPGQAPDGSVLVPLEKSAAGEETPAVAIDVVYLGRAPVWTEQGRFKLSLLALDMPVSKSGVMIHYSPIYRVNALPGSFRVASYEAPESAALSNTVSSTDSGKAPAVAETTGARPAGGAAQALISRLQETGRVSKPARNLPIRVSFPHFGPYLYLVSELTSENQTPVVEFDFQRDRKRGRQ